MSIPKLVLTIVLATLAIMILDQNKGSQYIETYEGNLPIIISVPHDGEMAITDLPERKNKARSNNFKKSQDKYTKHLAFQIAEDFYQSVGKRPYLVINLLHRRYMDANRAGIEAYEHPLAKQVYHQYELALKETIAEVKSKYDRGILLDIHGQSQYPDDVYLITLNNETIEQSLEQTLRHNLQNKGYSVPIQIPDRFGTAGAIIDRYGKHNPQGINAVQLEVHRRIRYSAYGRENFAKDLSEVLVELLKLHD